MYKLDRDHLRPERASSPARGLFSVSATEKQAGAGLCIADFADRAGGFSWDMLGTPEILDLTLPPDLTQADSLVFHTDRDSPNYGGFGSTIPLPARRAVLHWWGNPVGQNPWGIVDWLCNPAAQVSAHVVIWRDNVSCIVDYNQPSWANGNYDANTTAITMECDPNDIEGTTPTVVEWLANMVRDGNLAEDFELTGHRDWYNTACPGTYYPSLAWIRQAVRDNLAGKTTTTGDNMPSAIEVAEALLNYNVTRQGEGQTGTTNPGQIVRWWDRVHSAQNALLEKIEKRLPGDFMDSWMWPIWNLLESQEKQIADLKASVDALSSPQITEEQITQIADRIGRQRVEIVVKDASTQQKEN